MQKKSSSSNLIGGWEAHAMEQIRHQLEFSPLERLQALEQLILFAHKYAGIAVRQNKDATLRKSGKPRP